MRIVKTKFETNDGIDLATSIPVSQAMNGTKALNTIQPRMYTGRPYSERASISRTATIMRQLTTIVAKPAPLDHQSEYEICLPNIRMLTCGSADHTQNKSKIKAADESSLRGNGIATPFFHMVVNEFRISAR